MELVTYLAKALISLNKKKQACMALFTAKLEYIPASHGCAQIIRLKHQLFDYGVKLEKVPCILITLVQLI